MSERFELQQKKDKIKTKFMEDNELFFIRIRYDQDIVHTFDDYVQSLDL